MVSDADCRLAYGDEDMWDHMICAGYTEGGKDSCNVSGTAVTTVHGSFFIAYVRGINLPKMITIMFFCIYYGHFVLFSPLT